MRVLHKANKLSYRLDSFRNSKALRLDDHLLAALEGDAEATNQVAADNGLCAQDADDCRTGSGVLQLRHLNAPQVGRRKDSCRGVCKREAEVAIQGRLLCQ